MLPSLSSLNTYQYPTDKKVRKRFEVPTYIEKYTAIILWDNPTIPETALF